MLGKILISGIIFILSIAGAAAGDLPPRTAPAVFVAPPQILTWTGFYAGATAGYSWNDTTITNIDYAPVIPGGGGLPGGGNGSLKGSGVAVGETVGYNYQVGQMVLGLEADGSWLSNRDSNFTPFDAILLESNQSFSSSIDALVTGRGRVGLAVGRELFFLTGGLAAGHVENKNITNIAAVDPTWSEGGWRLGWTAGAGVEVKIAQNWSVKGEGLYYQLANETTSAPNNALVTSPISHMRFGDQGVIARVGVNYLFDFSPAPVIAKY